MQGPSGPPGGPEGPWGPDEEEDSWEPLPPRSMRPVAALAAVVLVSGVSGFGTIAYIAGNAEHVTSADGSGAPVVTTTATTAPPETTTTAPEDSETSEDAETSDTTQEDQGSDDAESTTTTAPPDDSGGSSSGLSPEDTVMAFFEATKEGDCETAVDYMSEQALSGATREQWISQCAQSPMAMVEVQDAELVKEEGDSATVNVTVSQGGQAMTAPMKLTREDGEWKLASGM